MSAIFSRIFVCSATREPRKCLRAREPLDMIQVVSLDEKIACFINIAFGAALGFAIYFLPLGGFGPLLMSRGAHWWNGAGAFCICVGGGGLVGFMSYKNRLKNLDIEPRSDGIYSGFGGQGLLWRRLVVIVIAIVALYYIWSLAKGV